jgi:MFS transporter, DHA2 family, multidrug resistance protein
MTDAVLAPSGSRAGANPWVIAAIVVIPTFMEVLDTTITVVALRYIAGGLSATVDDGEWVITSYLAANAIILPITGWLSAHLGRRNYFLLSIAVFTLASGLCGMATSLGQLIVFRVVQGLAGGGLQPSSQGVLLDAFPPEKQGVAMTLFGLAALLAPVVGPTLGGWITDSYSWRWVFYINIPVGLLALAACYALLRDPDYLTKQRMELRKGPFRFDSIGLSLLVIVMVSWEVMLSKGQEWDWLSDPFWRVQTLAIFFAVGLIGLIFWELRHPSPVVNFRPMRERNFSACCLIIFCAYMVLYAASTSLPGLLQSLFGYDALNAGLVMSPAGFFAVVAMPVVGTSLAQTMQERRDQFHTLRLGESLDPFNPAGDFLPRAGSGSVSAADRRSGCCAAARLASTREFAPAASFGTCLFRCVFDVGGGDAGAGTRGAADETVGGRERRSHRSRMRRAPTMPPTSQESGSSLR